MSRRKQVNVSARKNQRQEPRKASQPNPLSSKSALNELLNWYAPQEGLFAKAEFHGNTKWVPEQLAVEALIWSWQDSKNVTDAFDQTLVICGDLGLKDTAKTYTGFMNALDRYHDILSPRLRERYQALAEKIGGPHWRTNGWVLLGFDGSRVSAPRTVSNERAFCAPNYGHGKRAKYGKKKSQGLRRQRNQNHKPQPQAPQAWITMLWQMKLRLPWTWRIGPSNSSERGHVVEMLEQEEFPDETLFCGDAGFVGYPLWHTILKSLANFLVRVGANVNLLRETADIQKCGGGIVLCWPKGRMNSGEPPLRLRLVKVKVGRTNMWMLTSVLDRRKLTKKQIIRFYKMRWGIEVEFRGLKQTIDKHTLRCRNSDRLLVELDWSIRAMAIAELLALREQMTAEDGTPDDAYDPIDRSLANTMRALRTCMRSLDKRPRTEDGLLHQLSKALVQRYVNHTDKRSRYRPKNPDKKPLGDPEIRKMTTDEREKLIEFKQRQAA
jgi:DDE family transposase